MGHLNQNLLLIPGLICDDEVWAYPSEHLSDIANISILPMNEAVTMQGLASAVLKNSADKFSIAGFSMGGYVALEVLRQAPERVMRIALLDTSSRKDTQEKLDNRRAAISDCEEGRFGDLLDRFLPQLLTPKHLNGSLGKRVRTMGERVGSELFANRHRAMLTRTDSRELLKNSNIPVRAIVGRKDALTSVAEHEEIAALSPLGRLSIIEDCAHMPPLEQPQTTTALLRDWLLYD
ncbi:MAG: alpha/beta hydrolase [Rhodospirillaceae bacterium]|nr:alpha/beta hydrolase [Rhodospirillaceae bacterium]